MKRRLILATGLVCMLLPASCGPDAEVEPPPLAAESAAPAEPSTATELDEGRSDGEVGGGYDSAPPASDADAGGNEDAAPTEDAALTEDQDDASDAAPGTVNKVRIFLIELDGSGGDGREIGCGDLVVGVTRDIEPTAAPLGAAFELLLSLDAREYGESGFVTALQASDLRYERATIEGGSARVELGGDLVLGGVCDGPRVKAQLEETALQFSTVDEVEIFIDGVALDELLSLER